MCNVAEKARGCSPAPKRVTEMLRVGGSAGSTRTGSVPRKGRSSNHTLREEEKIQRTNRMFPKLWAGHRGMAPSRNRRAVAMSSTGSPWRTRRRGTGNRGRAQHHCGLSVPAAKSDTGTTTLHPRAVQKSHDHLSRDRSHPKVPHRTDSSQTAQILGSSRTAAPAASVSPKVQTAAASASAGRWEQEGCCKGTG